MRRPGSSAGSGKAGRGQVRRRGRARRRLLTLLVLAALVLGVRAAVMKGYPLAYRSEITECARGHGIDPYLIAAVIRAESRFRPEATSPQGARGLMQLMPDTGRWVAAQMGLPYDDAYLYDPVYNIRLGCWYLAALLGEFAGDPVRALAAYNGGMSNVYSWLDTQQWTGERDTLSQIPFSETRHYVANVLRDQRRYRLIYGDWKPERTGGDDGA